MIVYGGSNSIELTSKISAISGFSKGDVEIKTFPDGEIYVRILSDVCGKEAVLVQSALDNNALVESLLLLDALRDSGAKKIHAVFPYLVYMRQDKKFMEGEALSAKTVLSLLNEKSDYLTLVNAHFLDTGGVHVFHGMEINNLDALPLIAKYFAGKLGNPVFVAPDEGAREVVGRAAEKTGCEFDYLEKNRINGEEVEIKPKDLNVEGRAVVILDDMISTGGTMIEASRALRSQGAKTINLGCVHGVFSKGTEIFNKVCDSIVCTDTLPQRESLVSVTDLIVESLKE
ncbi:MAG: ribose-phosphate diphosphokinase [Candidatus Altiarchaeales archaeon ex4484_2]|nr:MAG: ribose-phosphate diphosphokinase [Candidatus Altiarchaeales archaeon ex4484_2]